MGRVVDVAKIIQRFEDGRIRLIDEYRHRWSDAENSILFRGGMMMLERMIEILEDEFNKE